MTKANNKPKPAYELKHRITGAVIIVLVAILVIPLLLSEPALEASYESGDESQSTTKTFRSRIVPLNISNVNGNTDSDSAVTGLDTTVIKDSKPALLDLTKPENSAPANPEGNSQKQIETTTVVMTQKSAGSDQKNPKKSTKKPDSNQTGATEAQIQQGWVVRVGTFSKEANVVSVSILLTNSGLKPRTTAVSTSLGNSTRVWLGPYAKKQTADEVSARLKSLIGEKGYVTRTNS